MVDSTIDPGVSRQVAEAAMKAQCSFVDAPVSGKNLIVLRGAIVMFSRRCRRGRGWNSHFHGWRKR